MTENAQRVEILASEGQRLQLQAQWLPAAEKYLQALALAPQEPELFFQLAQVLRLSGRASEAIDSYQQAITLEPDYHDAWQNLGLLLSEQGRFTAAVRLFEQALARWPDSLTLYLALARVFFAHRDLARACKACQEVLQRDPQHATAYALLAEVLVHAGEWEAARQCLDEALRLAPEQAQWLALKGFICLNQGEPELAHGWLQQALDAPALETLMYYWFSLRCQPDLTLSDRLRDMRGWEARAGFAAPLPRVVGVNAPERPLRIGYVSGDLATHSAALNTELLLRHHQREQFTLYVYSNTPVPDRETLRLQALLKQPHWRHISGLSTDQVCAQITADQIDILVDMNGYTAHNRLDVFARKPAPLQVSGLGYGDTTGLGTLDYLFSDRWIFPPESAPLLQERLLYLPEYMHWQAPTDDLPISVRPAGPLVMGSGNSLFKLNLAVLRCWLAIMRDLPTVQLHLKNPQLEEAGTRQRFLRRLSALGFDCERVVLLGKTDRATHHAFYSGLDLVLDPFPYNGGISTLEALWMSRPVLSLKAPMSSGVSILMALGHPELIATDPADYHTKAVALLRDRPRLQALQGSLRSQLQQSALCDGVGFVRAVETAYRQIWRAFCQGDTLPSPTAIPR
jgi:protein O-GlcNAc transferase